MTAMSTLAAALQRIGGSPGRGGAARRVRRAQVLLEPVLPVGLRRRLWPGHLLCRISGRHDDARLRGRAARPRQKPAGYRRPQRHAARHRHPHLLACRQPQGNPPCRRGGGEAHRDFSRSRPGRPVAQVSRQGEPLRMGEARAHPLSGDGRARLGHSGPDPAAHGPAGLSRRQRGRANPRHHQCR